MLATSDNNTAELLVKEMGLARAGTGTREAGLGVMTSALDELGLPMVGVVAADGSGLSNDNRVTCQLLVALLSDHTPTDALGAGLPVAGVSGTMADIFTDSPLAGKLAAKTGTLGNAPYNADPPAVKSLSGYVPVEGGGARRVRAGAQRVGDADGPERVSPDLERARRRPGHLPERRDARPARPPLTVPVGVRASGHGRCRGKCANGATYGGAIPVLPMFPLGTVLLPGAVLPLHVFEPRYRQLVIDCLASDDREPEFGVTLIERGLGGRRRGRAGGGRHDRTDGPGRGARRRPIRARRRRHPPHPHPRWLPDDPYPVAEVRDWPDDPVDQAALRERVPTALARLRVVLELAARLGEAPTDVDLGTVSDEPQIATYHLAALAPIGPADTYRLLCAPDPLARLVELGTALDDVEAVLRFRLGDAPA